MGVHDVSAYVVAANPAVQKLLSAMAAYDVAVGEEVKNLRRDVKADINALEGLYGLAVNLPPPPPSAPPMANGTATASAKSAKPSADSVEIRAQVAELKKELDEELRAARDRSHALQRNVEAMKPALFYQMANALDEEACSTEQEYAKYADVIAKWKSAHADLVKVAKSDNKDDLAALLGTVVDLAMRMKDLKAAIEGGKK